MRRVHAAFAALFAALGATALVPATPEVVDLVTGEPVAGARLEPIDPTLRLFLEPLYGPLHAIAGLPDQRIASWFVWIALLVLAVRLARRKRAGELRAKWLSEIALVPGYYLLYAAVALPLIWLGVLPKRLLAVFLAAVPGALYTVVLLLLLARSTARGRGLRIAVDFGVRSIGILGFLGLAYLAFTFVAPGRIATGRRLIPPSGTVSMDLHAHAQTSQDAVVGAEGRLDFFAKHRVSLSAVTEHGCFDDPEPPETVSYSFLARRARERNLGMLLLPGEEFTTHALHLVLLGIRRTFPAGPYRLSSEKTEPPFFGYDFPRLIADVHREGGYVIVAHWWSHRQWDRVDWRHLVGWGVDGFEITSGPEVAPPELIAEWRRTGKLLVSASDFHGWHPSLYSWNLVDGSVLGQDPWDAVHRLFRDRRIRVAGALGYDPEVPAPLEPPAGLWRYFRRLPLPNRIAWLVAATAAWLAAWGWSRRRRTPPRSTPNPAVL